MSRRRVDAQAFGREQILVVDLGQLALEHVEEITVLARLEGDRGEIESGRARARSASSARDATLLHHLS